MNSLVKHWWIFALRGLLALLLAGCLNFVPSLLQNQLIGTFFLPAIVISFALYVIADGALLLLLTNWLEPGTLRRTLLWQAGSTLVVGITLLTIRLSGNDLHYLVIFSLIQSGVAGTFELVVAGHLRRHLADEYLMFATGTVSLLFFLALLLMQNGELSRVFRWIVSYAIFFGLTMFLVSLRLRAAHRRAIVAAAA